MKDNKYQFLIYILIISFFKCSFQLICPPDHFSPKDYYWSEKDYDNYEKTYVFNFNYIYVSIQYNDFWSGIVYEPKKFCYEVYSPTTTISIFKERCDKGSFFTNFSNFINLEEAKEYIMTLIDDGNQIPNPPSDYVKINKNERNIKDLYKTTCSTKREKDGDYYKIMLTMDVEICPNNKFYLIFDLVNPSNTDTFYFFKAHRGDANTDKILSYEEEEDSEMFDCEKIYNDLSMDLSTTDESAQNFVPAHSVKRVFIPIEVSEKKFFDEPNNLRYYFINNNNDKYFFHLKHDDWANKLNEYHNSISYPIFSNLEIQLWSKENKLYVASYSMAFDRKKNENNYAGCVPRDDEDRNRDYYRTCEDTDLRTWREVEGCCNTNS